MMHALVTLAIPIAPLWLAVTGSASLGGALGGHLPGLAILLVLPRLGPSPHRGLGLRQAGAAFVYLGRLIGDITEGITLVSLLVAMAPATYRNWRGPRRWSACRLSI